MKKDSIALLGAGSWGTAVAIHLGRAKHQVFLWGHSPEDMAQMAKLRTNTRYLSNYRLPDSVFPCADLRQCLEEATQVIIAVPSHAFAQVLAQIPKPKAGLTWLSKGIDSETHELLSTLVAKRFGKSFPVAILSGPSFAKEVAEGLPTALTLASNDVAYQEKMHHLFHHQNLRVYLSRDLIGLQVSGTVKNILAIACGISDSLHFGANAKAALITRGLAEMSRLGCQLGAKQETFLGLAGVGDLVVTCTDNQSRNRRFGLLLGQGIKIEEAQKQIGQVVEGKTNAAQIYAIAKEHGIEMPICEQVHAMIQGKVSPEAAVKNLMSRPARFEGY